MLSGIRVGSQGGCQLQGLHQSQRLLQNRRLLCPPEGLPGADYGICIWFQPGPEAGQDENLNARDLCLGPKGSSLLEPQSFLLELAGGEQTPPTTGEIWWRYTENVYYTSHSIHLYKAYSLSNKFKH